MLECLKVEEDKCTAQDHKASKLKAMAQQVITDNKNEFENLFASLKITEEQFLEAYIHYDLDIFAYGNEIFAPLIMRVVLHAHNLLQGSWHIDRQRIINQYIEELKPRKIIDLGFGVPTSYLRNILMNDINCKVTLNDLTPSAFVFADIILQHWNTNYKEKTHYLEENMDDTSLRSTDYDVYIFQDSIEHVDNPSVCLSNFVQNSKEEAIFILSLPIEPIIPCHTIAWLTVEEAEKWLNDRGLKVIRSYTVPVNPEIDLFAEQLDYNLFNYIVMCNKK